MKIHPVIFCLISLGQLTCKSVPLKPLSPIKNNDKLDKSEIIDLQCHTKSCEATVKVGQKFKISFAISGFWGYKEATLLNQDKIENVKLLETFAYNEHPDWPDYSTMQTFVFQAIKEGSEILTFNHRFGTTSLNINIESKDTRKDL